MERTRYSFLLVGAVLAAGAFVAIQMNTAVGQAGGGVVPPNATDTEQGNATDAGNFTITEEGLGNGTMPASIPTPIDTTQLRIHIDEAKSAMQANDTQGAMTHVIMALEEIETMLGGNATSTANATDTMMGNATMTDAMQMNSTSGE